VAEPPVKDQRYSQALTSVQRTIDRYKRCNDEEKSQLKGDVAQLRQMQSKLSSGRVDIVIFGEISTGKSALINALVGEAVAEVDVQGGWTKEVWRVPWDGAGYCVPGFRDSQIVLIDTPGLNEVGGADRTVMAEDAAQRADLILFVTDSDLNETEFSALTALDAVNKPIILVFNKVDLYDREQRERLVEVLRDERLSDIVQPEDIILASADPREVEYIIESADGSTRSEWRKPKPNIESLKYRILQVLENDGMALLALNAAMYAADKSDRIASLKVEIRARTANATIWSYATTKSIAVAVNPLPVADVIGGTAVDVAMVVHLAHAYGIEVNWSSAQQLVSAIVKAAGWMGLTELTIHTLCWAFTALTGGWGRFATALPQGAVAGYGSYIVGQSAKYYFEHGASWGGENPKEVVTRILEETDKDSVIQNLKGEIQKKLLRNKYSKKKK